MQHKEQHNPERESQIIKFLLCTPQMNTTAIFQDCQLQICLFIYLFI